MKKISLKKKNSFTDSLMSTTTVFLFGQNLFFGQKLNSEKLKIVNIIESTTTVLKFSLVTQNLLANLDGNKCNKREF